MIALCAVWCVGVSAQDNGNEPEEQERFKELTDAMQNAQMILSSLSGDYECDHSGYDVRPVVHAGKTVYLVVIVVEDGSCDDLLVVLNRQGAGLNLNFVTEREMPEMTPPARPPPKIPEPPTDYTLIHEINPEKDE